MEDQIKDGKMIKDTADKLELTLVPSEIIRAISVIRMYAVHKKYGDAEAWQSVELDRWKDAAYRHFLDYLDDPKAVDAESGYPHLWHLACNIAFLIGQEKNHGENSTDHLHR